MFLGSGVRPGQGEDRQAADQRGRWSLPGANGIRQRLGVSGWRLGRGDRYWGWAR